MRYLLTSLLLALLTACVPYSSQPLTPPDKDTIDPLVLGTWFWNEEHEAGYIHIGRDEESGLLRVMMLSFNSVMELDVSELAGHTSTVNGNRYLNLRWVRPAEEASGYMLIKYQATAEKLGMSLMDNDAVEAAIEEGKLQGQVKKEKWTSSVQITAGQEELQQFVLSHDKELFGEIKYIPRLNLPPMPSEAAAQSGKAEVPH
jgi:hypothetical protein